jgi:putative RecB family exonuclease
MIALAPHRETANERALRLIGRDYLSFSAISMFQTCPLKFKFRYVDGLREETVPSSLVFGGAIHAVLEFHFRELMCGAEQPDLDTLLGVYHEHWSGQDLAAVQFGKRQDLSSLAATAERVIVAFQQSDAAKPVGRILGIEEELREPVMDDCPDLLARLDLITETPDEVVVTDFKTASRKWKAGRVEIDGDQLLLYADVASLLVPEKPLRLEFVVLTKGKEPSVERLPVPVDAGRILRLRRVLRRVWQAIEAGNFYPAPSAASCPTCPFRVPCRHWSG